MPTPLQIKGSPLVEDINKKFTAQVWKARGQQHPSSMSTQNIMRQSTCTDCCPCPYTNCTYTTCPGQVLHPCPLVMSSAHCCCCCQLCQACKHPQLHHTASAFIVLAVTQHENVLLDGYVQQMTNVVRFRDAPSSSAAAAASESGGSKEIVSNTSLEVGIALLACLHAWACTTMVALMSSIRQQQQQQHRHAGLVSCCMHDTLHVLRSTQVLTGTACRCHCQIPAAVYSCTAGCFISSSCGAF
jgi:hypothetical protein